MEFAITQNQASSAGSSTVARSSAGLETIIAGNRVLTTSSTVGTTPGYAAGDWGALTDGTATGAGSTLSETYLVQALEAAWTDGGDPSTILLGSYQKRTVATFAGAQKFAGFYNPSQKAAQGMVIGGVDLYISDFGEHKLVLDRFMRARTVLCIDPEYVSVAWLRPLKFEERAKTGDATRGELLGEWTLVVENPDAHAKVQDLYSA